MPSRPMLDLTVLRRATGVTQTKLAASLGVGQAQVSKIERRSDMLLSTLRTHYCRTSPEPSSRSELLAAVHGVAVAVRASR